MSSWIWLSQDKYPGTSDTYVTTMSDNKGNYKYCVAEFSRDYNLSKQLQSVRIRVSGDVFFRFFVNGEYIGCGPVCAGGDFLCLEPLSVHYANTYEYKTDSHMLCFFAQVQTVPVVLTDYSKGKCGFFLEAELIFDDGTTEKLGTDSNWLGRMNYAFNDMYCYDDSICPGEWCFAESVADIRNLVTAPIPMLSEEVIVPENAVISVSAGEVYEGQIEFDRIYTAHIGIRVSGQCDVYAQSFELPEQEAVSCEKMRFADKADYRSIQVHSCGGLRLRIENTGSEGISVNPYIISTCYPVTAEGSFECSDEGLNKVYEVCKWTLRICRQTMHLDSPKHQELLACTGDYYIESLMTAFTFGDMRLSKLDLIRTSDWLYQNKGVMFHTSYSLIWVSMLEDVFKLTGDYGLLEYCKRGLDVLLMRFASYIGENGLLESAPNYMFVDWTVIEGYSMHHPPKALGQAPLCAFYYGALLAASRIYGFMSEEKLSDECLQKAASLKAAFNKHFYDADVGLYADGLSTPEAAHEWLPENPANLRKHSRYSNILACLYGIADEKTDAILKRAATDDTMNDIQPYFTHFLLEALKKNGMFGDYGGSWLRRWIPVVNECDKGLKEGWIAPEPGYSFDHSHAWGGTPAYQLTQGLLGLEVLEPGMKRIRLSPRLLFGLSYANISVPTPFGMIRCEMRQGKEAIITVPEGIQIES